MKKTMKLLALILALGATLQAFTAYADELQVFSLKDEEHKVSQLMEMRKKLSSNPTVLSSKNRFSEEFPDIQTRKDLDAKLAKHLVRYVFALGAEGALFEYLNSDDVQAACGTTARCGGSPGI